MGGDLPETRVVLCHTNSFLGWVIRVGERIRWRSGATWNHAAIVVTSGPNPLIVQATGRGVTQTHLLSVTDRYTIVSVPSESASGAAFASSQLGERYGFLTVASIIFNLLTPHFIHIEVRRQNTWICSALVAESLRAGSWLHSWPSIYEVSPAQLAQALGAPDGRDF